MKYSDINIFSLTGEVNEDDTILPFHKSRTISRKSSTVDVDGSVHMMRGIAYDTDMYNSDDEKEDASNLFNWNLRKLSAATFELLANVFKETSCQSCSPCSRRHKEWMIKESQVLSLGAIVETHMDDMVFHVNSLSYSWGGVFDDALGVT
ncbi:transportin-1-like [Anopheles merus]|nr:transportin-1-like [Anopheles merus]